MKGRIASIVAGLLLLSCAVTQARQPSQGIKVARRFKVKTSSQEAAREKPSQGRVEYGVDGAAWKRLGDAGGGAALKLTLVRGIYDGLMYGGSPRMEDYYTKTSFENLVAALDKFFADPLNEKIYVVWGLQYVASEMKGAPEGALYVQLYQMRKSATSTVPKK